MIKQKASSIIDQAAASARNFLISVVIARYFGVELFGVYILAITLTMLVVRLHAGLVNIQIGTEIKIDNYCLRKYLSRHVFIFGIAAFISIFIYITQFPTKVEIVEAVLFLFYTLSIINNEFHRRACLLNGQYISAALINVFMCLSVVGFIYCASLADKKSMGIIYAAYVLGGVPSWVFLLKIISSQAGKGVSKNKITKYDYDVCGGLFFQWLSGQCVYYLTFIFIGIEAVAIFGVYRTLFSPFYILVSSLDGYFPARLSGRIFPRDVFRREVLKELACVLVVVIAVGAIIFPFHTEIITGFFNKSFVNSSTFLYLLIFFTAMSLAAFSRVLLIAIRCSGENTKAILAASSSLVFIFVSIVAMSRYLPEIAAPAATAIGETVLLIYAAWRYYAISRS